MKTVELESKDPSDTNDTEITPIRVMNAKHRRRPYLSGINRTDREAKEVAQKLDL